MGCGAAKSINKNQGDFYLSVAKAITRQPVKEIQAYPIPSIAVESNTLNTNPPKIYELLFSVARELFLKAEIIIIDLDIYHKADLRGTALLHIASAIRSSFEYSKNEGSNLKKIIILMPEFPSLESPFFKLLKPFMSSDELFVISDNGNCIPSNVDLSDFDQGQYKFNLSIIRGSPIKLLSRKIIRQHGHFKHMRDGKHVECVRTYFNGELCNYEIRLLLEDYLLNKYNDNQIPDLIYHCTISNWLQGPLLRIASEMNIMCYQFTELIQDFSKPASWEGRTPTLIVPLIHSGDTITAVIKELRSKLGVESLNILSILSTSGPKEEFGIKKIQQDVDVDYFLKILQPRYIKGVDSCPMCELGVPFTRESVESEFMLSSYNFWEMTEDSGLTDEIDVPLNRKTFGKVPNFPVMLDKNGAWIAKKIGESILDIWDGKLNDLVVICPDQTGSQLLTEYLRIISGVNVIRIPTDVIDNFRENGNFETLKQNFETQQPEWYMELKSAPASEVVIMDEFNVSGGTRSLLKKLLSYFRKDLICYFSLADFNINISKNFYEPCLSLYEWQTNNSYKDEVVNTI